MASAIACAVGFLADQFNPNRHYLLQVQQRQHQLSIGRRGRKQRRKENNKLTTEVKLTVDFSARFAEFKSQIDKCLTNWETLPTTKAVWMAVCSQRASSMIDMARRSLENVQLDDEASADCQSQLSLQIAKRVNAALPGIEQCRTLMRKKQLPGGYRFQGSLREIWGFQDTSDIDLVLSMKRPPCLQAMNVVPGFCVFQRQSTVAKINQRHGRLELFRPGRRFNDASATSQLLSPGKFRRNFSSWRMENSSRLMSQGKLDPDSRRTIQEHGPAVTHSHCFIVGGREERREVDFVCTVRLLKRPWLLDEWVVRQTKSEFGFSQRVLNAQVHVVPIGAYKGPTKQCSHAWRYSTNEIECRLIEEFTTTQGAAYALLKKVCHRYLNPAGFKSYHVKTCFFWILLAQPTEPEPSRILELVQATVDLMLSCAAEGFMPNYFMPFENVLRETVQPSFVNKDEISAYLESFAQPDCGEKITDLTPTRLASYLDQLTADIQSGPPPKIDWTSCLCRFNDVVRGQKQCEGPGGDCDQCDSLMLYELKRQPSVFVKLQFVMEGCARMLA